MLHFLNLVVACIAIVSAKAVLVSNEDWDLYKVAFTKVYSPEEELLRKEIFTINYKRIEDHNKRFRDGEVSYTQGANQFTDMTQNEVKMIMNGFRGSNINVTGSAFMSTNYLDLPKTVDWRKEGLVTKVKNQGACGSCWAFSTTGSLEGQHMKKTGKLTSLSEQNLVDCSWAEGNMGCGGGLMDQAFTYIKKNNGIDSESSYPYKAEDEKCTFKKAADAAKVTGFVDIKSGDEHSLMTAVATVGPISVAIDANHPEFMSYSSGILDIPSCSSTFLDHGVLAVGYGTENGKDYWLVKNSWGASWGMSGYVKMSRNKDNQCGIATKASYPLV
ncbi:Cathepsin L [Nymphon striatum]|nr:Cathepsin L [Nymphon striatum]